MAESDLVDPFDPVDTQREYQGRADAAATAEEKAQAALRARREAYVRVFGGGSATTPNDTRIVLEDLARFCRIDTTTFNPDPRIHALLEGRREVMQRIRDHTTLDFDTLWSMLTEGKST